MQTMRQANSPSENPTRSPRHAAAGDGRLFQSGCGTAKNHVSGSALLVTLGMLAIATTLVFAFVLAARTERIASRQARDRAMARHHLDTALSIVMEFQLPLRLQGIGGNRLASANGLTGGFDRWAPYGTDASRHFLPNLFTSYESDTPAPSRMSRPWSIA